ncbi:MAG: hypothetical protein OEY16_02890 [Alphaproteobacteria bacterium]|nr:hypothetical protein [Alphaproteobacteria bacterium]
MKTIGIIMTAALAAFVLVAPAMAALSDFEGDWQNADRNTNGIKKLQIGVRGANVMVQAWGACSPRDCDWGAVQGAPYSSSVNESMTRSTKAITAIFNPAQGQTILIITQAGPNKIKVESYSRFKSGGRNNYMAAYTMVRARVAVQPTPTPTPTPPPPPQPTMAREDCIAFNTNQVAVKQAQGRWKVAAGNMWLMDFGTNKPKAEQALRTIRQYRLNKQCFVGRPNPPMQYYLSGNNAPAGGMAGEDCLAFNPRNIQVKQAQGRWKIADGNSWLLDFEGNKAQAQQAHAIINKYGFSRICFVGRPNPPMTYFRQ